VSFRPLDLLGIVVGIGLQLFIGLLYLPFRSHLKHFDAPITKLTGSSHGGGYLVIVLLTVFLAPAAEEIFFRGLLLRSLVGVFSTSKAASTRRVALAAAVVLDGLLFGLSHGEMAQLPGLALVGVVLSLLFLRTGRLGTSMVTHMSFNAVAVASYASSSGLILWLH
jgi:membrane protease YdiL (CAAX protease family)